MQIDDPIRRITVSSILSIIVASLLVRPCAQFVAECEREKRVLLKTFRVAEKGQEAARASSRPQSAASHSSVGSALRAYEYATLNMPAPTNQV
jgi:hypothetical protein